MRHAGNFNPEWGYLAPAPNLVRTTRLFVVAAAIGATASAAVVFSLMDRTAAETSVAARTLVQPVEPPMRAAHLLWRNYKRNPSRLLFPDAARGCIQSDAAAGCGGHRARELRISSCERTWHPVDDAKAHQALPRCPKLRGVMTTEAPPARALVTESSTAAAPGAAPAPAPAPRAVMKKPRAVARAVQPRYDLPRYAAPRYHSMQRGPYAFLRQYGFVRSGILTSGILTTASRRLFASRSRRQRVAC